MSALTSRRASTPMRVGKAVAVALLLVFTLFPAYWMLVSALDARAGLGSTIVPAEPTFEHFRFVLTEGGFATFLRNSLLLALGTVLVSSLFALLASVAVARFRFRLRTQVLLMVLIIQMVPLEALVIPLFVQVRDLELLGTLTGLGIVYVALALPFGIWMLRGFVAAVPVELEEAAYLDGATWGRMFRSVLLPLVAPGLVATSIFSFITAWNQFLFAMTILGGEEQNFTVAIGLRSFFGQHSNDWGAIMAASTVITVPVMIFFIIVQRRLAAGLTSGAVKG